MLRFLPFLALFIPLLAFVAPVSAEQVVWIDQEGSWPLGGLSRKGPGNLLSPADFTKGHVYVRYEVLEKPSSLLTSAQVCQWQSGSRESCAIGMDYTDEGVYYRRWWPLEDWWHKNPIDYTSAFRTFRAIHKAEDHNGGWLHTCSGSHCYGGASRGHIPIKFKLTAILTTEGHDFVPPADWVGCPAEWGCTGEPAQDWDDWPVYTSGHACHMLYGSDAVPQGFSAAYDVFDPTRPLVVKAFCLPTRGADIQLGNGGNETLIYEKVYAWSDGAWEEIELSGYDQQGAWFRGVATGRITRTRAQMQSGPQFFVGFVCTGQQGSWRCGCRDQACASPNWQLQAFTLDGQ